MFFAFDASAWLWWRLLPFGVLIVLFRQAGVPLLITYWDSTQNQPFTIDSGYDGLTSQREGEREPLVDKSGSLARKTLKHLRWWIPERLNQIECCLVVTSGPTSPPEVKEAGSETHGSAFFTLTSSWSKEKNCFTKIACSYFDFWVAYDSIKLEHWQR